MFLNKQQNIQYTSHLSKLTTVDQMRTQANEILRKREKAQGLYQQWMPELNVILKVMKLLNQRVISRFHSTRFPKINDTS